MTITRLITILCVFMLFSCKKEEDDKTFKIYHLTPNRIYTTPDSLAINGSFLKRRNDFFVVKNYNINNENHKIEIDSFVINYMKKDTFLTKNKNANWRLTFFKHGDGIDENTRHDYGTDYTIHNLFSHKKEIGSFYFDTRIGYGGTNYNIQSKGINKSKRKIISDYFETLGLRLGR